MDNDEATFHAESMSALEQRFIALCSPQSSIGYHGLAQQLGIDFQEASSIGARLRAKNLATVSTVRTGREFSGSAIFLNERGTQVKDIIKARRA